MNETQLNEIIGRQHVEIVRLTTEYARLLEMLRLVKVGEIDVENITIDSAAQKWAHTPQETVKPD